MSKDLPDKVLIKTETRLLLAYLLRSRELTEGEAVVIMGETILALLAEDGARLQFLHALTGRMIGLT